MNSVASGTQVLDRAVALIDAVARAGACTLAELVEATGLPRPTAHRLATALERERVRYQEAAAQGDVETAVVFAGECVDLINDVPAAGEIVARLVAEAERALAAAAARVV